MKAKSTGSRSFFALAFLLIAILVSTIQAQAQTPGSLKDPEERAKALTQKMKTELSLTEEQVPKVEAINLKYARKNSENINKGSNRKLAIYRKLQSSQKEKDVEMKEILTADQYKKYTEMVKEMEKKFRERRGND